MPEVSVVLPTCNGERYIRESICSVLGQTFRDWELIIVDDCSMDRTPEIAEEYAALDARIRVIHNAVNQKLPEALNIGFRQAKGRYLTWTSDDNIYLPKALETMAEALDKEPDVYMVCTDMTAIDEDGQTQAQCKMWVDHRLALWNQIGACFMYRREVLHTVGEYDPQMIYVEDYDYWIRIKERYGKITSLGRNLYLYRFHSKALTSRKAYEIKMQQEAMRERHIDFIVQELGDNRSEMSWLYYARMEDGVRGGRVSEYLLRHAPELSCDVPRKGEYVIFGAGGIGGLARKRLGQAAVCFADNDRKKVGTRKDGLEIISFDELKALGNRYPVMIAVQKERIYEIMKQLYDAGVRDYCTYQSYCALYGQSGGDIEREAE